MKTSLRIAQPKDIDFAFEVKRKALGPYIISRWGWDENIQRKIHETKWVQRPWYIVELDSESIGTVAITRAPDHIQFGEFYLLPDYQGQGIGSEILSNVITESEVKQLPIRLEYLKWNPVGSLYARQGFRIVSENDTHYFLNRIPNQSCDA
jgi:GNAT superfamily N-acetyltransferase